MGKLINENKYTPSSKLYHKNIDLTAVFGESIRVG